MLGLAARITTVGCAALVASLVSPAPAAAEPEACRREINKAAIAYARTVERVVDACKKRALARGIGLENPPGSFDNCTVAALKTSGGRISKAADKMQRAIAKKCGGDDRDCAVDDNNDTLASINWDIGTCMNFPPAGATCTNTINHCGDIGTCLECIADRTVEVAVDELLYDQFNADSFSPNDADGRGRRIARCQVAVAREATRFLSDKLDILRKCWDDKLRASSGFDDVDPCPDTDPKLSNGNPPASPGDNKTVKRILSAEHKKVRGICRKCGGGGDRDKDLLCDEVDEPVGGVTLALADIVELPFTCPDVVVPANAVHPTGDDCGQYNPVDTLQKYVDCIDCSLEFKADCLSFAVLGDGSIGAAEGIGYPPACRGL